MNALVAVHQLVVAVHQLVKEDVLAVVLVRVTPCAMAPVKDCAQLLAAVLVKVLVIIYVSLLQNSDRKMKVFFVILLSTLFSIPSFAQEDCIFETYYRNPIDTTKFVSSGKPSVMLFVHSKCGHSCPTRRMQEAFEADSCSIRNKNGIKLYVVYPSYSEEAKQDFDSYKPKNAELLFWVNKPENFYGYRNTTPYIILFNGKGQLWYQTGGTYEDFVNLVKTNIVDMICPLCKGAGYYQSHYPDFWLDPLHGKECAECRGKGRISKKN